MKLKTYVMLMLFGMSITFSSAQNEIDALRYSNTTSAGTARSQAMGGAFCAVGADFASAYVNPAGLGLFRKSSLMFTPGIKIINTQSDYLDATGSDVASNVGLSNFGYVFNKETNSEKGLKFFSFGIGFNQIANYNRNVDVAGFNPENSITQRFAELAEGFSNAELTNGVSYPSLAYYAFMINPDPNGSFTSYIPAVPGGNIRQRVRYIESGRNNEWNISFAGNLDDFIFLGASLGIRDLKYDQELLFTETDVNNVHVQNTGDSTNFNSMTFSDNFRTRGTGINAKLGVIVKATDFLRLGLSVQTPTLYNLTDTYYTEIIGTFDGDPNEYFMPEGQNQTGQFSYKLTTPFVLTTGAMLLIKKSGFISADFEVSDYTGTKFGTSNSSTNVFTTFRDENNNIRDMFSFNYNYRIGGEYRIGFLRLRGGFAHFGSVLKKDFLEYLEYSTGDLAQINGNRRLITGGVGFKQRNYYIDLAFVNDVSSDRSLLYDIADPAQFDPELVNRKTINSILMTIGFTY